MSTPKPPSSSTRKWLSSKKERRPLQQLYLTPPNFAQYNVPKWKDTKSSTPTPTTTKQATLDQFLTGDRMRSKSAKGKIKGQSAVNVQTKQDEHDSIQTITPPPKEDKVGDKIKGSNKKRRVNKTELAISPIRRSPRLTQRSRFTHKVELKLELSPPLPIKSRPVSTSPPPPLQIQNMSLSINTRDSQQQTRSVVETSPSYHTAPPSPIDSTPEGSLPKISSMGHGKETTVTPENEASAFIKEIPSSIPWENTLTDGWADAWPSSQESPRSSQNKTTPTHNTQPQYNDGFRVPDPPSSRHGLDDTQDDSQGSQPRGSSSRAASLLQSPPKPISQHRQSTTVRIPEPINWSRGDLDETQDETQDDTQLESPVLIRKRKRETTINEIPDSEPSDDSFSQQISPTHKPPLKKEENSLILLSQAPASMRRKDPEIIPIHSTQSQSQESSNPQTKSQSFARTSSDDSQNSHVYPPQHNWASSQPTQSSVDPLMDMNLMNPPSQMPLSSQNDLSRVPEPLAMTLEHGILRRKSYEDWVDLDDLEKLQDLELQQWEVDTTQKGRRG